MHNNHAAFNRHMIESIQTICSLWCVVHSNHTALNHNTVESNLIHHTFDSVVNRTLSIPVTLKYIFLHKSSTSHSRIRSKESRDEMLSKIKILISYNADYFNASALGCQIIQSIQMTMF